jgi:hypothetical protein
VASAEPADSDYLTVDRTHRRTALVALRGELVRQNEYARSNRHNLAVARGTPTIQRLRR